MKFVIVSGSMRGNSQSLKVSNWLSTHAEKLQIESEVIDLNTAGLPEYDGGDSSDDVSKKVLGSLESSDAAILVSPEWNGTMSHGLANLLVTLGKQLAHKPVMLVGVSSGRGGHYPLIQMRNIGYKNSKIVISPENLLVQDCNNVLNDHDSAEVGTADNSVKARADYALRVLAEYSKALASVRDSGVVDDSRFSNGV